MSEWDPPPFGVSQEGMPGEDLATRSAEDAARWICFYTDLVRFETEILATMEDLGARLSGPELELVERTNLVPMRSLIAGFQSRRRAWEAHAARLAAQRDHGEG